MTKTFPAFHLHFVEQECDQLENMLRGHDWYYEHSDDARVYARGVAQYEAIREQVRIVNDLEAGLGFQLFDALKP